MNATVQALLVSAIVALSSGYAVFRLMPASWRRTLAAHAGSWVARSGLSEDHARRVEAKLSSGGACGSCDSCKACATPIEEGAASSDASPRYRSIPIRRAPS